MNHFKRAVVLALTAAILLLTCAACDQEGEQPAPPTEKQVWLVSTYVNHAEQNKGTYYYNEYGNEIRNENYHMNGEFRAIWYTEYDQNQNMIQRSVDSGNSEPFVQLINTYDEHGNLVKVEQFWSGAGATYIYRYDSQNRCVAKLSNGKLIETYIYAEDGSYRVQPEGYPDEYTLYDANGRRLATYWKNQLESEYVYNEDGVLIEIKYDTYSYVYELDQNGNAVKEYEEYESGYKLLIRECTYELYTVKILPGEGSD